MTFTADFSQVEAETALLLSRIADPVPFFEYVGVTEKHAIQERIMHTKLDPEGNRWAQWAPYTEDKRYLQGNASQGIMWDTSVLLESIRFSIDGAFGVDIGTDTWYAEKHQEGDEKLPKREILGWEDELLVHYAQAFVNFIERGIP